MKSKFNNLSLQIVNKLKLVKIDTDRTKNSYQQSNEFTLQHNRLNHFKINKKKTSDPSHEPTSISDFVVDEE